MMAPSQSRKIYEKEYGDKDVTVTLYDSDAWGRFSLAMSHNGINFCTWLFRIEEDCPAFPCKKIYLTDAVEYLHSMEVLSA